MRLSEIPAGYTIFLDANCFLYHFTGTHPSCAVLLERARRRQVHAVTSAVTMTEMCHRLMVLETSQLFGRPLRRVPSFLKTHPDAIRRLRQCQRAIAAVRTYRIRVLPVTSKLIVETQRLSHELGLLTNDAVIVATMRAHRLIHLASNDADFIRVPGVTLWRP
ncbi:MAG: type II toxin-antitoxin system VapC family toxin [Candidatus Omnitrophica bacterium]|nr:type II toxin-antitoxin system VapC family toxin [Candidatus Omnitrophota bacterium]